MDEVMCVEGPVIKLSGELILLITLAGECTGLAASSGLSECLKLVIPAQVASMMQIEAGDMVCLRSVDGVFRLHALKANAIN
jgi:hypothetical protein